MSMTRGARRALITKEIDGERERQDAKWGVQKHPPDHYVIILNEEFLEAQTQLAKLVCDWTFRPDKTSQAPVILRRIREELVQVVAVAVAMMETIDEGLEKL